MIGTPQPTDNGDNAWRVYADWLQDNDVPWAEEFRDLVLNSITPNNRGIYESGGGDSSVSGIGGVSGIGIGIGVIGIGVGGIGGIGGIGGGIGGGGGIGSGVSGIGGVSVVGVG